MRSSNEFYGKYIANNKLFAIEPFKKMQRLKENLLRGVNYKKFVQQRQKNFDYLDVVLKKLNAAKLKSVYGAFTYLMLIKDGAPIRKT